MAFNPPLGATVQLTPEIDALHFTYIGSPTSAAPQIWTNAFSGDWHAVPFESKKGSLWVASLKGEAVVPEKDFEYTYRYEREDGSLEWLGQDGSNGRLVVGPAKKGRRKGPSKFTMVETFSVPDGKSGDTTDFDLTEVLNSLDLDLSTATGLVLERTKPTWFTPRQLAAPAIASVSTSIPTQFLLLRLPAPQHRSILLYPFCTSTIASSLFLNPSTSSLTLRCTRDSSSASGTQAIGNVVIGVGNAGELQDLAESCVDRACRTLWPDTVLSPAFPKTEAFAPLRGLTWCTWNALGPSYTLSGVLNSLDGLQKDGSGLQGAVEAVLLDDGWQDTQTWEDDGKERRGLKSFGTREGWLDVEKTSSLKEAVQKIKAKGVKKVGVWITIAGYWDGIHPSSSIGSEHPLSRFQLTSDTFPDKNTTWHFPSTASTIDAFYSSYFSSLKAAGVDFIKIDDQAQTDYLISSTTPDLDIGVIRRTVLDSCHRIARSVFGSGNLIHCMAGSPRLWASFLALDPSSSSLETLRTSDDYFPSAPDSHRFHVAYNAQTSLLTHAFPNLAPDFDMCEERHEWGEFHIAAKAFQAAPVLATDKGDATSKAGGWQKLLARSSAGMKVLKSVRTGAVLESRISEDVLGGGEGPALKMSVAVPNAGGATVGLWNCRAEGASTSDVLDAGDVVEALGHGGDEGDREYAIFIPGHDIATVSQQELAIAKMASSSPTRLVSKPLMAVSLGPREAVTGTIAPFFSLPGGSVACIGLLGKYAGVSAISSIAVVDPSLPSLSSLATTTSAALLHPRRHLSNIVSSFSRTQSSGSNEGWRTRMAAFVRSNPIRALYRELTGLLGWVLGFSLLRRGQQDQQRRISGANRGPAASQGGEEVLRIRLDFIGRLGLVMRGVEGGEDLSISVGGKAVSGRHVRSVVGTQGMIQLDLEEAVGLATNNGEPWVVDVRLAKKA